MSLENYVSSVVDVYVDNVKKIRRVESASPQKALAAKVMDKRELRPEGKGLPAVVAEPEEHKMIDPEKV